MQKPTGKGVQFDKAVVTRAYAALEEHDKMRLQAPLERIGRLPGMGEFMAKSILAHLGAWLVRHEEAMRE